MKLISKPYVYVKCVHSVIKLNFFLTKGYELTPHATANFTRKMMADYLRSRVSIAVRSFMILCLVIFDSRDSFSGFTCRALTRIRSYWPVIPYWAIHRNFYVRRVKRDLLDPLAQLGVIIVIFDEMVGCFVIFERWVPRRKRVFTINLFSFWEIQGISELGSSRLLAIENTS